MSLRERLRQWFFRRQRAQSGPIELDRRGIYILPTRTGILFGIVLVLMYVGAVNYNLGLGHALVFLLAGLGLAGMLHAFRNLVGLRIRPGKTSPVFAGEYAHFEILLENQRSESRPAIHLQCFSSRATLDTLAPLRIDLEPNSLSTLIMPVLAVQRGMLSLDRLVISTRYPLGLFRAWSYPWPVAHCLVFPTPVYLPLPPPRGSDHAVGSQLLQVEGQDDFAGFRRHQAGDSPRHVAWKIYARDTVESPLLVKEFSGTGLVQYWLDWTHTSPSIDVEERLSILCGWVLQARRDGLSFGLTLPGFELAPGHGEGQATEALTALALYGEKT